MKSKFTPKPEKRNWLERLFGRGGKEATYGQSKHNRGKRRPNGWRRSMRNARKRERQARRANR